MAHVKKHTDRLSSWGVVVPMLGLWGILAPPLMRGALRDDFLCWYVGAKLAWSGEFHHMYDPAVQWAVQQKVRPDEPILSVFPRPPFFAALVAPMSVLPLRIAFAVWIAIQLGLLAVCLYWAARKFGCEALAWGALSGPAFLGIACGQDTSLMLAIILAGYVLAEHGRDRLAGMVWGLALIKFNLLLVFPLAMLATRRWRMLQGFAVTTCGLGIFSLLVLGREGLRLYLHLLSSNGIQKLNPAPGLMINLQSVAANLGINSPAFLIAATTLVLAVGWVAIRKAPVWRWLSLVLVVSLLVAPHVFAYNATMLLLPTWFGVFVSAFKWTRIAAALCTMPILFLLRLFGEHGPLITPLCLLTLLVALATESIREQAAQNRLRSQGDQIRFRAGDPRSLHGVHTDAESSGAEYCSSRQ
jgi:hypothetical protein